MSALSPALREWDAKVSLPCDCAVRGTSASRKGMKGSIREAVARAQGLHTVELMWDISSFYDSINIPRMAKAVKKKGLPLS